VVGAAQAGAVVVVLSDGAAVLDAQPILQLVVFNA
jgi:hypothetical protein